MTTARPAIDRLLDRLDLLIGGDGCWEWTGTTVYGYGQISSGRANIRVHRLSYETFVGPIPEGHHVLHRCDNPPCWNPSHLFTGTDLDNARDCISKGRSNRGERNGASKSTDAQVEDVKRRVAAGERQVDVAASLGLPRQTVHRWVHGKNRR